MADPIAVPHSDGWQAPTSSGRCEAEPAPAGNLVAQSRNNE